MSVVRVFDEIVVILNQSTDGTRELVQQLACKQPRIRLLNYDQECAPAGAGYMQMVCAAPSRSLAKFYNLCMEQTTYSHICKWDGDMIALPTIERVRTLVGSHDVVIFDGYDVLGEYTTDNEPRIFRFDPERAQFVDWDLYEVLSYDYGEIARVEEKCYLHMKLLKRDWIHKPFVNPNAFASRSVPPPSPRNLVPGRIELASRLLGVFARALRRMADLLSTSK